MARSDTTFYGVFLASLALCLALYAEEALHFKHYGWKSPDNMPGGRQLVRCRPVPGTSADYDCPVQGYGWAQYRDASRFGGERGVYFVDRTQ